MILDYEEDHPISRNGIRCNNENNCYYDFSSYNNDDDDNNDYDYDDDINSNAMEIKMKELYVDS